VLTTSAQTPGQSYLVTVSGVRDRSSSGNLIAAGSTASFTAPAALPPVLSDNVPEASDYALIYQLAIPNTGNFVPDGASYSIDESRFLPPQSFDRIAYSLELATPGGPTNWVYVSMDAFTGDLAKIGVPTVARGAMFQQYITNMNVYASANAAVTTGTSIATGNIEFWPGSYNATNSKNIPNALGGQIFDFGDSFGSITAGHGSMQIHNYGAAHTILSLSRFGNGMEPGVGIGNNTVFTYGSGYEDPDWTLHPNATTYSVKNLYVLARWGDTPQGTGPLLLSQPVSRTVRPREAVRFYVQALGATFYQWRRNGVAVEGANQPWLDIPSAALEDAGSYDVLVYGSGTAFTTSQSATLQVVAAGTLIFIR